MNYSNKLLTYVCPKCLRYLSIKLDGISTVKVPEGTCLTNEDTED